MVKTTNTDTIEKWKILYDLDFKRWQDSYNDLPEGLRDRNFKLIPIYTTVSALLPWVFTSVIKKVDTDISLPLKFVLLFGLAAAIIGFIGAFIFVGLSAIRIRTFKKYPTERIYEDVVNASVSLTDFYSSLTACFQDLTKDNLKSYNDMLLQHRRSYWFFFVALFFGIFAFTISNF